MHFAYVYFMKDEPDRVRLAVPKHVRYWRGLQLEDYSGGPFADRSGGLIVFKEPSPDVAQRAVESDPFAAEDLLETYWLKEWAPE